MRTDFRFQKPADAIYRVGPVIGGVKQAQYTSIQDAINAAVADGHTDNSNPAIVEIYPGTYTENVTLNAGVHLKGMGSNIAGDNRIVVVGSLTYSLGSGVIDDNIINIYDIEVNPPDATQALIFSGTSPGRMNIRNCNFQSSATGLGVTGLVSVSNIGGGTSCRFTDCNFVSNNVNDNEIIQCSAGMTECYGGRGLVVNLSGGTIPTAIGLSGTAVFNARSQNFGFGSFTQFFNIGAAGVVCQVERTTIQNTQVGGFMFNFSAAGTVRARFSGLFLQNSTSKIANGAAGSLVMALCTFSGTSSAPFSAVDSGITVNGTGETFAQKNSAYNEFQVGRGVGYSTIQAAINAAAASATGARKVVKIPAGNYTENLTLAENVDLVADSFDFAHNGFSPVTITGTHTLAFANNNATVNLRNIRFQSLAANANPLFTVSGANSGNSLRLQDCFLNKSFAGSTSMFDVNTTGTNFNLMLQECIAALTADGGAFFDLSGALNSPSVIVNSQQANFGGFGYQISAFTAGTVPAQIPFVLCPAAGGSTSRIQGIQAVFFSSRIFFLQSSGDNIAVNHCRLSPAFSTGEVFKFGNQGEVDFYNNTMIISGDGEQTGIPLVARDGGDQASGTFTFNANPAPGDTVTVNGTIITFNVDVAIGATAQDTALNLANFINTLGTVVEAVHQDPSLLVTVKALETGLAGNAITFSSATAAITASGAGTLADGTDGNGGQFNYGGNAFGVNYIQSSLTIVQAPDTLTAI